MRIVAPRRIVGPLGSFRVEGGVVLLPKKDRRQHRDRRVVMRRRGFHRVSHRRDVRVEANAGVLNIEHEHIETREHGIRWPLGFPIEAVDGQAGVWVNRAIHDLARCSFAANPVLGAEEGDQLPGSLFVQQIDGGATLRAAASDVGDEPEPSATEQVKALAQQDVLEVGHRGVRQIGEVARVGVGRAERRQQEVAPGAEEPVHRQRGGVEDACPQVGREDQRDDPRVDRLAADSGLTTIRFGLAGGPDGPSGIESPSDDMAQSVADPVACPVCGQALVFSWRSIGHLGDWACPLGHVRRPIPDVTVSIEDALDGPSRVLFDGAFGNAGMGGGGAPEGPPIGDRVAHVERGDNIRIINARLATRRERLNYEEGE